MNVLETDRLTLRWLALEDAPFIFELLNDPSWIRFIGDKGIRTLGDARDYIVKGPGDMYARLGFGLYLTLRKEDGAPIGLCGLIKRDTLDDVDVGFAFLPRAWGQGYAREATAAVIAHGKAAFHLKRLVAITSPDNVRSGHLLENLGFHLERMIRLNVGDPEIKLFARDL
jgi:RimJ/RimL family protein N-acetyltransferase